MLCITANLGDAVDGAARAQFVSVAHRVAGVILDREAEFAAMRGPWSTASRRPDRFGHPTLSVRRSTSRSRAHAIRNITRHIDGCYNTTRLHTGLGYQTPSEAHAGYRAAA